MGEDRTAAEARRWIGVATAEHARLLDVLDAQVTAGRSGVAAPSRLPGWSVGHVLTHVARSGDGHLLMLDAAAAGTTGRQYPGGRDQRAHDIEAGATRPVQEQLDDLRASCAALEQRWATMPGWGGSGEGAVGAVAIADLPFLRVREVAVHHVDLGLEATFGDLPPVYLREELRRMEMLWRASRPMGMTPLPPAALASAPPARLAWLMGRQDIAGLGPAGIF